MIRPISVYNKWRFARNLVPIGRAMAVLCGNSHIRREELTDDELSVLEEMENENEEMDKAMAKEARRKAEYRASKSEMSRDVLKCPRDKTGQDGRDGMSLGQYGRDVASAPNKQTNKLTNKQIERERGADAPALARCDVPDLDQVVEVATSLMGVEESYARWWHGEMVARDWQKTDGGRVTNGNWRSVLKSWWNREDEKHKAEIAAEAKRKEEKPRVWTEEDWVLCHERCSMWKDGRCRAGKVVPPDKRPHPIAPEECDGYWKRVDGR